MIKHEEANCLNKKHSPGIFLINVLYLKKKIYVMPKQCLSQDLETGCLKLAVVTFLGVQNFKGDPNILIS